MEAKDLKEISQIIKNLNVTFDGKFNSETCKEIIQVIAPYYKLYIIKEVICNTISPIFYIIGAIALLAWTGRLIFSY